MNATASSPKMARRIISARCAILPFRRPRNGVGIWTVNVPCLEPGRRGRRAKRVDCAKRNVRAMDPSRTDLEETFQELADDELLRRCTSGELTDLAQSIALAEVRARGLELPPAPEAPAGERQAYLGDWVAIARYLSFTEVHLLRACLEAAGIPAAVADAQLIQTDGLLTPAMRGASLRVPAAYATEAQGVIAAFKRGDFELDENFKPDPQ